MQSDELATSRTNQPPSWSRQQGPSYFGQFLKMMTGFMARTGLYLFVFPNIADMPRDVPTDKEELRTFKGAYEIETKAAFRLSNIKAWGYLQWSVASYPDILGIVNQNTHDYIGALISIKAFTAGSATARLYSKRMIDMPKIFSDIKSRVDILRATTQANALNQQINSINPDKAFKQEELHERLVHVLTTPPLNLVDVHRRAHTETDLKIWHGLCAHLHDIIRPNQETAQSSYRPRETALLAAYPNCTSHDPICFKCGEEGHHRSRVCPLKDIKCTKCGHPSHSAEHHDRVMEMLKRRAERDRNSDDKPSNAKASSAVYVP